MNRTFMIVVFAFVNTGTYAQNFTDPNCTSLTPDEYLRGYNEGYAYGKESLRAAASYYGIQATTISNPVPGATYQTLGSGVFDDSGNWVNNYTTGTASLGSSTFYYDPSRQIDNWPQLTMIRETISQGPYCPIFNDARSTGFEAGFSGLQ